MIPSRGPGKAHLRATPAHAPLHQLKTRSSSSSFTPNVTWCGGSGCSWKNRGRRSCSCEKPARALNCRSTERILLPSATTSSAVRLRP